MTSQPQRWVFMLKDRNATQEQADAIAAKIDALGQNEGFKTIDSFPRGLLVEGSSAFAKEVGERFASELGKGVKEGFAEIPDTRPKIRKPPGPDIKRLKVPKPRAPGGPK